MLAVIKMAKHRNLGPDDVIVPVATDGAAMYISETTNAFTPLSAERPILSMSGRLIAHRRLKPCPRN